MTSLPTQAHGVPSRMWSLLLIAVLCVVTLTACKDANDPACANPDDPPLLSAADSGEPLCDTPDPDCEGCGGVWGDPHITTLDGAVYDLQAVGEFTVASLSGIEVQARFAPWGDSRTVSLVTGVAVATDAGDVSLTLDTDAGDLAVRVDGQLHDLADGAVRVGDALLGFAPSGNVVLAWPDGTMVAVQKLSGYLTMLLDAPGGDTPSGLLGDADGDTADTFTTRDGTDLGRDVSFDALYGDFAESWRITDQESAFWYAEGTSTETFTDRTFPDTPVTIDGLSADARSNAAAVCSAVGVTQQAILDACTLDVAATGDAGFADAALATQQRMTTTGSSAPQASGASWVTTIDELTLAVDDRNVASDDTQVYVLADDAEGETFLVAIDGATGAEAWRTAGAAAACGVGVLDDGRIAVVGSADGDLASGGMPSVVLLDPTTGKALAAAAWEGLPDGAVRCSPMEVEGSTVAIVQGSNTMTGWQMGDTPELGWTIDALVEAGPEVVAVPGGFVTTTQADGGGLQAMLVDAASGSVLATRPVAGKRLASRGVSLVSSGSTVVVSLVGDDADPSRLGTVTGLTASSSDLQLAWTYEVWGAAAGKDADHTFGRTLGSFSLGDGLVVGHAGNELVAWDASTGALLWRYVPTGFRWTDAPALIADGVIWDGAFGGPLVSRVSTDGVFLGEDFGDDLMVGGSRSDSAKVFGPSIAGVVIVTSENSAGSLIMLGLPAK